LTKRTKETRYGRKRKEIQGDAGLGGGEKKEGGGGAAQERLSSSGVILQKEQYDHIQAADKVTRKKKRET